MPSQQKLNRIEEICKKHDLDYFNNDRHKQTIEFILMEEFPDEVEYNPNTESASEENENQEKITSKEYWMFGLGVSILLLYFFWEYIITILVICTFAIGYVVVMLASSSLGSFGSSHSNSSYSYKPHDSITYGLQRQSGAVWTTIAQGPENWMIDKLEQNRAKDNSRYRVVMIINGKVSGTTYS
jgi:hypothetical protein